VNARRPTAIGTMLAVAVFVVASCGDSGSGIASAASAKLQLRVVAIRAAAARGDRETAAQQLADLRVDVVRFRAANDIDDPAAARILRAASAVQTELALLEPASTTTTAPTTTTEPPPPKRKGHGKGGKQGNEGD
jgi:hypothetical protein